MIKDWFGLTMLAFEAQQVMWLRLLRLGAGGPPAVEEAERMLSEKVSAAAAATLQLATGGSADAVIRAYRRKVRANHRRLSRRR